ncbi:hypothetical protein BKA93DRAFT_829006 [Sparassis latifolia]|uniref:Uncharacterized protein n=1 Tax=Sparassis crispa TaxID=139825 RepID=A0A401GIK1_9APHY|nr:hypothetical protein SCP_0403150 [Sparassis crispa]GBE81941.1 hypothetical protein SCP_0403150 [Sparassis crispa]
MPAIHSPQPRRVPFLSHASLPTCPPLSPIFPPDEPQIMAPQQNAPLSPPPLMPPIDLVDSSTRKSYLSKSSPCSTTKSASKRRRGMTYPLSCSSRRHCTNKDCFIKRFGGPALFDSLSWISALESAPELVSVWDTADLSVLVMDNVLDAKPPRSGPIRNRKSPVRSNPLPSGIHSPERQPSSPKLDELRLHTLFPFSYASADPRTPPPPEPFIPSQIRFRGLYPVLPADRDESQRSFQPDSE